MSKAQIAVLILVPAFLVSGCSPATSEPIIVRQTVVSEIPVTVEVTTVTEVKPESTGVSTEVAVPRTETVQLESSIGDRSYNILVALPEGYASGRTIYPVVYVLDGHVSFVWATEYSRWLSSGQALPETIIVGIDNSRFRNRDLVPDDEEGVSQFLAFIQEDLIPYVDENYRTKPDDRTLAGASYGGLFALYALFHAPDTFQRYIVTTPALNSDDAVFGYEEQFAASGRELPERVFISVGGRETTKHVEEFYDRLDGRGYEGLEVELAILEGDGHVATIIQGFMDGLRAVFGRR